MDRFVVRKRKYDNQGDSNFPNQNLTNEATPSTSTDDSLSPKPQVSEYHKPNCVISRDIGAHIGKMEKLDDVEKFKLLTDHWVPEKDYCFPSSSHFKRGREEKRRVNFHHFEKNHWLVFSDEKKGLFCKYCAIFSSQKLGGGQQTVPLKKLVSEPLKKYAKLTGKDGDLEVHASHLYHKNAESDGKMFISMFENPQNEVRNILNEARKAKIAENRSRLAPIVKTIILHGRQNIPLRGHRDDGKMVDADEDPTRNDGNFRSLLRFRVDSGDLQLESHLKGAKGNATYISKTTANELIQCCGEEILNVITRRISEAKYYSVLFDETTDISHTSQLSLSVRYIYENNIREDFIGFLDLHELNYSSTINSSIEPKISGDILGRSVIKFMESLGLNLNNCIDIGCDGCSVNISEVRGAVVEIKKVAKFCALSICKNHSLNLSLSKSSKVQCVRNVLGTMKEVACFFNASAKRNHLLKLLLGHQVRSYCETRWVERHDDVIEFQQDLIKISNALRKISSWDDNASAAKANCLFHAVANCEFIVTIHCMSDILASTVILSQYLQEINIDIYRAAEKIQQAIEVLEEKRKNCESLFSLIFENAISCMEEMDVVVHVPRLAKKQSNRTNYVEESNDPKLYWKRAVYIPILDHVIADIKLRFQDDTVKCFGLFTLIPKKLQEISDIELLRQAITPVCEKYSELFYTRKEDMVLKLLNEILSLRKCAAFQDFKKIDKSIDAYTSCDEKSYPLIKSLIKILTTLPISVASVERSFSALKRLKSWTRTRMSEERLSGLALLHVHRDIDIVVENVIDRFAKKKNRKLEFTV